MWHLLSHELCELDNEKVTSAEIHALQDSDADTVAEIHALQDSDADTIALTDTEMDLQNVHDNKTVALAEIHALQDSETDTVTEIQVMQDSDADTVTLTVVQARQESEQTEMKDTDPENDSNLEHRREL